MSQPGPELVQDAAGPLDQSAAAVPPATYDTYELLGYRFQAGSATASAVDAARRVLRGFASHDGQPSDQLKRYELIGMQSGWQIAVDGVVVPELSPARQDLSSALGSLEVKLVSDALETRTDLLHLHGASLCLPVSRAGLVLAGDSRSGKTTLTLGLMMRGFLPFTDDVTILDPNSLELQPVGRAFHVTPDTWEALEPLAGARLAPEDGTPEGYFVPPQRALQPVPVRWILFPEYRPQQVPALIRLSQSEAATALVTRTVSIVKATRLTLSTVRRLVDEVPCYRFLTGDLLATVRVVQQLVLTRETSDSANWAN